MSSKLSSCKQILLPRNLQYTVQRSSHALQAEVVVGITLCNQKSSIRRALISAMNQENLKYMAIVILDDHSEDNWQDEIADLLTDHRLIIIKGLCGSPARARNALLDFVDEHMPNCRWIARLDADDRLATTSSVSAAVKAGDNSDSLFVIGSNTLIIDGAKLPSINFANADLLLDPACLQQFIVSMAKGETDHELPSCNLLLKTHAGFRYPNMQSAEDHWLVAQILLLHGKDGIVMREPIFAEYSLEGSSTQANKRMSQWQFARNKLAESTFSLIDALYSSDEVLGYGMEGLVVKNGSLIRKTFHPQALNYEQVEELKELLQDTMPYIPEPTWRKDAENRWVCEYHYFRSKPVVTPLTKEVVIRFLRFCLKRKVIPRNIKRTNFRIMESGELCYIDIGESIKHYSVSSFRDIAARSYCQFILGWADEELVRRSSSENEEDVLAEIPGFMSFYSVLVDMPLATTDTDPVLITVNI